MMRVPYLLQAVASKLAALMLLAAALGAIAFCIVIPISERFRDLDERISEQRNLLGRYRSIAVSAKAGDQEQAADIQATAEAAFLPGETDALRLASLQATLNDAAAAQKIRLSSARTTDAPEETGVRLLSLQAQLSTDLEPLQKLLFNLEKQRANLIIDGLHIVRAPDGGAAGLPSLDVVFDLRGAATKTKD
jgi:hypothetical protein